MVWINPEEIASKLADCPDGNHLGPQFCNYEQFGDQYRALMFCSGCGLHYYRPLTHTELEEFRRSLSRILKFA